MNYFFNGAAAINLSRYDKIIKVSPSEGFKMGKVTLWAVRGDYNIATHKNCEYLVSFDTTEQADTLLETCFHSLR